MIHATIGPDAVAPCLFQDHDPVFEAVHIFCGFYEWALPNSRWLPGVDRQLALPTCECPIFRFHMTRGFQFADHNEPGSVSAVTHVVIGADAKTPIGACAWCLDQPADVYRSPVDIPALGMDQLDNPATYLAGKALPIYRTPLAWLMAGCRGIVPLDTDALWNVLGALPERPAGYPLVVEDIEHGRMLRDQLTPLPSHVRLLVPRRGAS